jgi:hypothetical protein
VSDLAVAIHPRPLTVNQETIDRLLAEHIEACETLQRGTGAASAEGMWGFTEPATWTIDHKELDRLLKLYRAHCKDEAQHDASLIPGWTPVGWKHDYWHVAQWYFFCQRRRAPVIRRDKKGRVFQAMVQGQPQYAVETVRHPEVDASKVHRGVLWLDAAWERMIVPVLGRGPQWIAWEKLLERQSAA